MVKFVDYMNRLIKKKEKNNIIIDDFNIKCAIGACDEMKNFNGEYDVNNEKFCKALGKLKKYQFALGIEILLKL